MTYKTVLMHCNDNRRIKNLLAPTLIIASRFQSHVVGLSVVPPVSVIPVGAFEAPPVIVDAHCELYRQEVPAMRRQFEETMTGKPVTSEWRDADAGPFGVADVVLEHGRTADLIVASQTDDDWPAGGWLDVADRLALESGRPVLIVPNGQASAQIGNRILVAWNGRREAARAVFDALPLLKHASATKVVRISESDVAEEQVSPDICSALVRHGVKTDRDRDRDLAGRRGSGDYGTSRSFQCGSGGDGMLRTLALARVRIRRCHAPFSPENATSGADVALNRNWICSNANKG